MDNLCVPSKNTKCSGLEWWENKTERLKNPAIYIHHMMSITTGEKKRYLIVEVGSSFSKLPYCPFCGAEMSEWSEEC